jgi:hypothetical protein
MPSVSSSERSGGRHLTWRPAFAAGRHGPSGSGSDDGMVTAELAMALPALVLVLSLLLSVLALASDVSRASDAARSAARSASIGTDEGEVLDSASRLAPTGSTLSVTTRNEWVYVTVDVPPQRWGPLALPAPAVSAAAPLEPGLVAP